MCVKAHWSQVFYKWLSLTSNHPHMFHRNWLKLQKTKSHNPSGLFKRWRFATSSLLIHWLTGAKSQSLGAERQVNHLVIKAQSGAAAKEESLWLNQWINRGINIFNWLITTCSTGDLQRSVHWLLFSESAVPFQPACLICKGLDCDCFFRWTLRPSGSHSFPDQEH